MIKEISFTKELPNMMHIDVNSCFATLEQQANPLLRGKPTVVVARLSAHGCILAASYEAKKFGINTGMRLSEAKRIFPKLIALPPDTDKYRAVHAKMYSLLQELSPDVFPKSIDEFVVDMHPLISVKKVSYEEAGVYVKERIKSEIGDFISVSIGFAPNRYLAKVAAGLTKPNGLHVIDRENYWDFYQNLAWSNITGIRRRSIKRLNSENIVTPVDFYSAPPQALIKAFGGAFGYYWYMRLKGYEADNFEVRSRSLSHSYVLPAVSLDTELLLSIYAKLVTKLTARARRKGFAIKSIFIAARNKDLIRSTKCHFANPEMDGRAILKQTINETRKIIDTPVRQAAIYAEIVKDPCVLKLFEEDSKRIDLERAADKINARFGSPFKVAPARGLLAQDHVYDRVSFGQVKTELKHYHLL